MKIDLKKTKIYLISPGENKYRERVLTVFSHLVDEGYKNITFFKSIPGPNNTASLTNTVLEIFKIELCNNEPFIILEDDCSFFHKYETLEIPDDYDVLYLGVSTWAYPHPVESLYFPNRPHIYHNSPMTVTSFDENLVKVKAMTSGHAILYQSRDFMKKVIEKMNEISEKINNLPHDLLFSALHSSYNVYALKNPLFYQDSRLGGQEAVTKLTFDGRCYR